MFRDNIILCAITEAPVTKSQGYLIRTSHNDVDLYIDTDTEHHYQFVADQKAFTLFKELNRIAGKPCFLFVKLSDITDEQFQKQSDDIPWQLSDTGIKSQHKDLYTDLFAEQESAFLNEPCNTFGLFGNKDAKIAADTLTSKSTSAMVLRSRKK